MVAPPVEQVLAEQFGGLLRIDDASREGVLILSLPADEIHEAARIVKKSGGRLAAEWATDDTPFGRELALWTAFAVPVPDSAKDRFILIRSDVPIRNPSFPTLTGSFAAAYRFERIISSFFGIDSIGHPDRRPWIRHEDWPDGFFPLRKNVSIDAPFVRSEGSYEWIRGDGEGVYEIPVGPVHAGIIEPGHFRFQAVGETILNLEERLGYVHKGIEKRFESLSWAEGARLAGRISGDSTFAHALAWCLAVEEMAGILVPPRAAWLRALLLERERIANHLGDIGAIANDAAFAFLLAQLSRLREEVLRLNRSLFGHRLLMDRIVPGGVSADLDAKGIEAILIEMDRLSAEFERLVVIYDENPSLQDRVVTTGIVTKKTAADLGLVGFVARASGIPSDRRVRFPFPPYDELMVREATRSNGDVNDRVWVRIEEVRESIRLIREILTRLPGGPALPSESLQVRPQPGLTGLGVVEGWRGEIVTWVQAGPSGEVHRVMVRDPSQVNWLGLERAVLGNIVPDFPLCNKSFNQSYSGHDL
jgi:Ni,Fe-hydrogenase III large subunit/Ni,Fe-hydrogenase III component G